MIFEKHTDLSKQIIRGFAIAKILTGKSNRQVCREAGISPVTYGRFIHHKTDILLHNLDKICQAYGMTLNKILALGDDHDK